MHSRIGCICLTFLRCVLSNESLNCLLEWMHSYTGYICWAFLHCGFSNVSSKHLQKRRRSHIGCNCLTYPFLCVSQNVLSNCLPWRMNSQIGCTCLVFLQCVFKCVLKLPAWANARFNVIHSLHWFAFSPVCLVKCLFKAPGSEHANLHWLHLFGFCPLCILKCTLKFFAYKEAYSLVTFIWPF